MSIKLSGKVSVHGEPARAAVVELHNAGGDVVDQIQVDDDGAYTYYLAPGSWSVRVWDNQGHRGTAEVSLEDGQDDTTLDLELEEPEGT